MDYSGLWRYDFNLPQGLIAQRPSVSRDGCRLLVYYRERKEIIDDYFYNSPRYLPKHSLLVLNNTRVIPARLIAKRQTGGRLEILIVSPLGSQVLAMVSKQVFTGEKLLLPGGKIMTVIKAKGRFYELATFFQTQGLADYLEKYGQMPVPPYIKHPDSLQKLKAQYQTVFAKSLGSVAAPTASLHFTRRLFDKLQKQKIKTAYLTLHVGLGTFLPLNLQNFRKGKLHQENYQVNPQVWQQIMNYYRHKQPIIAVGTTVARTLESITKTLDLNGTTDLFIKPPYRFKLVCGLLTNFHLPKSSLLLLVSAFIKNQDETLALYRYAVSQKYRFYSFGDAMLIL